MIVIVNQIDYQIVMLARENVFIVIIIATAWSTETKSVEVVEGALKVCLSMDGKGHNISHNHTKYLFYLGCNNNMDCESPAKPTCDVDLKICYNCKDTPCRNARQECNNRGLCVDRGLLTLQYHTLSYCIGLEFLTQITPTIISLYYGWIESDEKL